MKKLHLGLLFVVIFLISAVSGFFLDRKSDLPLNKIISKSNIETKIENKLSIIDDYFRTLDQIETDSAISTFFENRINIQNKSNIDIFYYEDSILTHWTNRDCPISFYYKSGSAVKTIHLSNGWYVLKRFENKNKQIIGSILIKKEYKYNNPYLPSFYQSELKIPDDINITETAEDIENSIPITYKGKNLFHLSINDDSHIHSTRQISAMILFALAMISLILATIYGYIFVSKNLMHRNLMLIPFAIDLVIIRFIMIKFGIPAVWNNLELFSPQLFAENIINNSLGDLLINAFLYLCFALVFHKYFRYNDNHKLSKLTKIFRNIGILSISFFLVFYSLNRFESLIHNSSIPFNFSQLMELNMYSFIGLGVAITYLFSGIVISDRLIKGICKEDCKYSFYLLFIIPATLLYITDLLFIHSGIPTISYVSIILIITTIIWRHLFNRRISYFPGLVLIIFMSLLITSFFAKLENQKNFEERKVLSMNLSNERDAGAEYFLTNMNEELCTDANMTYILKGNNIDEIFKYFSDTYMRGYLEKYDIQISICNKIDSLLIAPDNINIHCHTFFDEIAQQYGIIIPGTDFYFIDNNNGRISYLGIIPISITDSLETRLILELDSRIQNEGPGYPELLLDQSLMPRENYKDISYAKYHNGKLISQHGSYIYPEEYPFNISNSEYEIFEKDNWQHLSYTIDKENHIIVSTKIKKVNSYIIFFTYIFFLLFILLNIISLTHFVSACYHHENRNSMKNRIQSYFIIVLSLSIILIGTISIIFYINKYQNKQKDAIQEKMQSIQIELNHKLGDENNLTPEMEEYLTYLLVKFSNVFTTDINLFDLNGNLLASSREELYNKGLVGKQMCAKAHLKLSKNATGYFVLDESIGKMNYLSAYVPFKNNKNEILAYINLPYFAKQNQFREEISSLTVTVLNVYLILFLITIIIAIIISNQLTHPLRMIQEHIKDMDINKRSQKINYSRNDEIGSLVKEYNKKIDELSESAQRLAQSERESAWREMAKQIAHEIKNPLTPMKLSVQHLEKAYKDKDPNLDLLFKKVSNTLIEQIDSLSSIASEFSNFSKIRVSKKEKVNLSERIKSATQLFDGLSKNKISFNNNSIETANILADKEQVLRIFNNLIKNAVQSIPKEIKGEINISLTDRGLDYLVVVKDNGNGIPTEIQERIFSPNFTTKSSGMGLGLSIVKGIVKNINGNIYFKTEKGHGTKFYIEFPKMK